MQYQIRGSHLIVTSIFLAAVGNAMVATARPARVFAPYLEQIQNSLPPGLAMRLPTELRLSGASDIDENKLVVRVFSTDIPRTFVVSVSTCDRGPLPCVIGTFSADMNTSPSAVRELERHQKTGDRITLGTNITGYLLEGPKQRPSYRFSSVIWEQDEIIYTVTFPDIERQNILFMAYSMANQAPLRRVALPRPVPPARGLGGREQLLKN